MKIKLLTAIAALMLWCCFTTNAQVIAKLTLPAVNNSISAPVYINLDAITSVPDSLLLLREITGKKSITVPFQIETGYLSDFSL